MKIKEFFIRYSNVVPVSTSLLLKISGKRMIFPFYHSISDSPSIFIKNLYSEKPVTEFIKDLNFLLEFFIPISIDNLLNKHEKLDFDKNRYFLLSFDDGLSSFYKTAVPVLIEKEIPAVVFLNTGFIDNQALFYRYKVSIITESVKNCEINSIILKKTNRILNVIVCDKYSILDWLSKCSIEDDKKLNEIGKLFNISFNEFLNKSKPYLSKEQIKSLIQNGFNFGGHSVSHPLYNNIGFEEQIDETMRSVNFVQSEFAEKYKVFSFPFTDDAISKKFFLKMKDEEVVTFGTSGLKDDKIKNHFQRIPMEYSSNYSAKKIIRGELFYYIIKKIIKKNKIIRT